MITFPLPPRSYKWLINRVDPVTHAKAKKVIASYNRWAAAFNSRERGQPALTTEGHEVCWYGPRSSLAWRKGKLIVVMRLKGWQPFDGNGNRLLADVKDIIWAGQWKQR